MFVQNEPIEISADIKDDKCDASIGSITLQISGGDSPFTYLWENGSTQKNRSNLAADTYCVTVTDEDGCDESACFDVEKGSNFLGIEVVDIKNASTCVEGEPSLDVCDGAIDIEIEGSNGPFTYSWIGPNGFTSTSEDINDLCRGNYRVTVTTPSGCQGTSLIRICCCSILNDDPSNPSFDYCYANSNSQNISIDGTVTNISSTGANDGAINLQVMNGTGRYKYTWSGPNGFSSKEEDIDDLAPGTYCVTVEDGCKEKKECFEVIDCSLEGLSVSGTVTNTCTGLSFGIVNTNVSGGTSPYSFQWSNGSTAASPSNFSAGEHCVTVTDKNGCQVENCFTVGSKSETETIVTCGSQFSCNGNLTTFEEFTGPFDFAFTGCRTILSICPLTGDVVGSALLPFDGLIQDFASCTTFGICPVSGLLSPVSSGSIFVEEVLIFLPDCGCFGCFRVTSCLMNGQFVTISVVQINPDICGPPGGQAPTNVIDSDLTMLEFFYALRENQIVDDTVSFFIPEPLSEHLTITAYTEKLAALRLRENDRVAIYELLKENELQDLQCSTIDCREHTPNNGGGGRKLEGQAPSELIASANFKTSIYPNPFSNEINIRIVVDTKQSATVRLFDLLGKVVVQREFELEQGSNTFNLQIEDQLPSGIYELQIQGEFGLQKSHKVTHTKEQ